MARFALRLVELPTRNRRELENLVRAQRVLPPRALLDACSPKGEVDAIVMEADRADELERMQEKLQDAGIVTVLVDRDAREEGEGFLNGVLKRRTSTQTAPVAAVTESSRDAKQFKRLRQDGALRQVRWWEWWLERGAMRLKLFLAMLFLVAGVLTSIALTGLLTPVAEFDALTQTDEADENGNPVPSTRTPMPGSGSGDEMPETAEQPESPRPQPGGAGAPQPSAAAAASESETDKPEPPIARWIGWAIAGVVIGFLTVLTHRLRHSMSTRMARNLHLALWAVTGGTLVFLVLSVVRSRPPGPSPDPTGGSQPEPASASDSGAPPADEGSSAPSMSLPEWARTLPAPGSFSAMNQQLSVFPDAGSEGEYASLASALPPACEAPAGSFAELTCLLGRVPAAALPGEEAAEGSATDAATTATNNEEGSAAQLPGVESEGSANNAEAPGADTRSTEGSAATEGSAEGSSGEPARDASEGTGSQAVAAEASAAPSAGEQPTGADDPAQQTGSAADNNAPPADLPTPSGEDARSAQQPDSLPEESQPEAADAGQPGEAAQDPDAEESAEEPQPAGTVGSIISFLVGWLLGAAGAWLETRRRNIG